MRCKGPPKGNCYSLYYLLRFFDIVSPVLVAYSSTTVYVTVWRTRIGRELINRVVLEAYIAAQRTGLECSSAPKVGWNNADNKYPAGVVCENLPIQSGTVDIACQHHVKKLLFLGLSCIYPRRAYRLIQESLLKISATEVYQPAEHEVVRVNMRQACKRQFGFDAIFVVQVNICGFGDSFDLENSHVDCVWVPVFHEAKLQKTSGVAVRGSKSNGREYLYIGLVITELAESADLVASRIGRVVFGSSTPNGTSGKPPKFGGREFPGRHPNNPHCEATGFAPQSMVAGWPQFSYSY